MDGRNSLAIRLGVCLAVIGSLLPSCTDTDPATISDARLDGRRLDAHTNSDPDVDQSCRSTSACESEGKCSVAPHTLESGGGGCVATSDADCQASIGCKMSGQCWLKTGRTYCFASNDSDCEGSTMCGGYGNCFECNGECRKEPC